MLSSRIEIFDLKNDHKHFMPLTGKKEKKDNIYNSTKIYINIDLEIFTGQNKKEIFFLNKNKKEILFVSILIFTNVDSTIKFIVKA